MTQVAEIVTFTLAPGISDPEFVALSQASETFVRATPGFMHRHLSKGADGRWTDYVIWQNMETAQKVATLFPQHGFAPALMAAIAPGSEQMRHEEVHWQMMAA